jgi:hypothetical protein
MNEHGEQALMLLHSNALGTALSGLQNKWEAHYTIMFFCPLPGYA